MSTGPQTEAGKKRSRGNAVRHGLTAETVIVGLEDAEDYKAFELPVTSDFDAQTAVERELVLRLASLLWRLRRAAAIETGLLQIQSEILRETRRAKGIQPLHHNRVLEAIRFAGGVRAANGAGRAMSITLKNRPKQSMPKSAGVSCGLPISTMGHSSASAVTRQPFGVKSARFSLRSICYGGRVDPRADGVTRRGSERGPHHTKHPGFKRIRRTGLDIPPTMP